MGHVHAGEDPRAARLAHQPCQRVQGPLGGQVRCSGVLESQLVCAIPFAAPWLVFYSRAVSHLALLGRRCGVCSQVFIERIESQLTLLRQVLPELMGFGNCWFGDPINIVYPPTNKPKSASDTFWKATFLGFLCPKPCLLGFLPLTSLDSYLFAKFPSGIKVAAMIYLDQHDRTAFGFLLAAVPAKIGRPPEPLRLSRMAGAP